MRPRAAQAPRAPAPPPAVTPVVVIPQESRHLSPLQPAVAADIVPRHLIFHREQLVVGEQAIRSRLLKVQENLAKSLLLSEPSVLLKRSNSSNSSSSMPLTCNSNHYLLHQRMLFITNSNKCSSIQDLQHSCKALVFHLLYPAQRDSAHLLGVLIPIHHSQWRYRPPHTDTHLQVRAGNPARPTKTERMQDSLQLAPHPHLHPPLKDQKLQV